MMQAAVPPNGAPSYLPPHGSHGNNSSRGPSPAHVSYPLPGNMPPPPRPQSGHQQQYGYPPYGPSGTNMPPSGPYYGGQHQHSHQQRKHNNMYPAGGDPYSYGGNPGPSYGVNGPYYPPSANFGPGPSFTGYMPGPQMGGPGPATMQNAPWNYQDGYAPRQQLHPGHPAETYGQPHPYPMMNGHDSVDHSHFGPPPPPAEGHYNHPQQPPSHFNNPDGQYPGGSFPPQHHQHQHGPNHQHQQQPPYFPPGHPYANGGGFGYHNMPPLQQQPGFPYMSGPPHQQPGQQLPPAASVPTPQKPAPKSLNPAARGFEFKPAAQPFKPSGAPNGNTQSSQDIHEPTFPSLTPAPSTQPEQSVSSVSGQPNGDKPKEWTTLPVITSSNLANGVHADSAQSTVPEGGLGLSQMDPATTPPRAQTASVPMTSRTDTTDTTPGMTHSETSQDAISVGTPRANTERGRSLSPPVSSHPIVAPVENASGLKFVGPTVDGYVSPDAKKAALPPTDASQSTAQTDRDTVIPPSIAAATDASTAKQGADTPKADSRFLHVALHAPAHDAFAHNSYNVHIIPDNTPHNTKFVKTTISPSSSSWPGRKATKSFLGNPILSMGNGDDTPMKIVDPDMIFGELSSADIPAIVIRSDPQPDQVAPVQESQTRVAEDSKADNDAPVASSTTTLAPPVAKPKPSSWAALLGGGKAKQAAPSETASLGPSSIRVSPSKSVISLMTDTDAPVSDPVTPKSAAPSLPPPSTGVSATNGPRPAFNYAAAAAAGKNLSPENELVKLLTEGLKARSQKPTLPANVPRGLVNTGNMCFANTILQMLVYCGPFTDLFDEFGRRLKPDLARRTPLIESLIVFLREFQPNALSGSSTPASDKPNGNTKSKGKEKEKRYSANDAFIPENVYDAMKENKRFDSLRRGHQEDAEEFLGFFLETVHEEILHLVARTESTRSTSAPRPEPNGDANEIQRPVSPTDGWLEVGKKQKTNVVRNTETRDSAVSRIFGGSLRSVLHTPGQKDSVTLEPYQPLQLDIQSPTVRSITDALKQLNEPEVVPGVWSAARNCNVDATKQVYIETFPPVLILHLKRFVYDPLARDVVKKNKPIAYASELIIPQEIISPARRSAADVKYRLFAVDYHHGSSASGGHYTIAVARQDAKGWIHFDDETHSTLAEEDVVVSREEAEKAKPGLVGGREKCAYLLFYQRVR